MLKTKVINYLGVSINVKDTKPPRILVRELLDLAEDCEVKLPGVDWYSSGKAFLLLVSFVVSGCNDAWDRFSMDLKVEVVHRLYVSGLDLSIIVEKLGAEPLEVANIINWLGSRYERI